MKRLFNHIRYLPVVPTIKMVWLQKVSFIFHSPFQFRNINRILINTDDCYCQPNNPSHHDAFYWCGQFKHKSAIWPSFQTEGPRFDVFVIRLYFPWLNSIRSNRLMILVLFMLPFDITVPWWLVFVVILEWSRSKVGSWFELGEEIRPSIIH